MPFKVSAKHWWQYLNPFWWSRKRMVEAFMAYQWEHQGMKENYAKAVRDFYLYGSESVEWPPEK